MKNRLVSRLVSALLFVGILSVTAAAMAQSYSAPATRMILKGGTENIAAATTNQFNLTLSTNWIDVRYLQTVPIQFQFTGSGAGTDVQYALLARCIGDPSNTNNWDVTRYHRVALAQAGTTTVNLITNISCPGEGWLGLMALENVSAARYMTNIVLRSADKRP